MSVPKKELLQAYAVEVWRCSGCGRDYRPMIKTQPGWLRLTLIGSVGGLAVVFFFAPNEPPWTWLKLPMLVAFVAAPLLSLFLVRQISRRREVADPSAAIRYGQIIPLCPHCGASQRSGTLISESEGINFRLDGRVGEEE